MNVVLRRLSSPAPLLLAYAAAVALWSVPHLGWGGDDSMYVAHARALVEGWPYGNGHYVFSLESPHIGPPFYPPGTALLLAPVYAWAGWNLKALSLVMIACLCIALGFVYGCLAMAEGAAMALAVTALTALNPYVIHFTTYVLSEFPFMLWLYGSLFLLLLRDRVAVSGPAATGALSASIGLCIYFAYATREVGALLLAAMILRDALQREARWARILPAAGVFLAGLAAQRALLPDTSGFQGIVRREILEVVLHEPTIVARNIYRYAEDGLPQFFPGPRLLGGALSNLVLLAAVYGAIVRVRDAAALAAARAPAAKQGAVALARSVPVDLWFLLAYSALLVSLPLAAGGGGRYLLPILPMRLWNAAAGARRAARGAGLAPAAGALATGLLLAYFAACLVAHPLSEDKALAAKGPLAAPAQETFRAVARCVGERDTVIFASPRILAIYSGRNATAWPQDATPGRLERFLAQAAANYVLLATGPEDMGQPKDAAAAISAAGAAMIYSNADFALYRIHPSKPGLPE